MSVFNVGRDREVRDCVRRGGSAENEPATHDSPSVTGAKVDDANDR